jgi:hypothetical protein
MNKLKIVKQSHYRPGQTLRVPGCETPRYQDNRHKQLVRLSAILIDCLYPQEIFLVLIFVRDCVDPRAMVRAEDYVNEEFQLPHRESNLRPSRL